MSSTGCDLDDTKLQRLLRLELADLPQAAGDRELALHVELRCEKLEIEIVVREPSGSTSLRRVLASPEAELGRERVLALAIRQLVDSSFIELATGAPPSPPHDDARPQASPASPRAPGPAEPTNQPTAPAADLVAGDSSPPAQGPAAPAPAQVEPVDAGGPSPRRPQIHLELDLGLAGRALERAPIPAGRVATRTELRLTPVWSLLPFVASDWSTKQVSGGRLHALDLDLGLGFRARLPLGSGPFFVRTGLDAELGWGRVWARERAGFRGAAIASVVGQARAAAGVWAQGRRAAIGVDVFAGAALPTPIGLVAGGGELSLGGVFVGAEVGGAFVLRE